MRTSDRSLNPSLKKQVINTLAQVISDTSSKEDAISFLSDFFNQSELETFSKRLAIAYWLKKGRSYNNIKENLKVSSATVANVQSIMGKKGVSSAIKKVEAEEWANQWSQKIKKFVQK